MPPSSTITIYRGRQYAMVMPPVDALPQLLTALCHAGVDDRRHGVTPAGVHVERLIAQVAEAYPKKRHPGGGQPAE